MSFYNRGGYGSLVRFPGLGGFAALPSFETGSIGPLGMHEINNWLAGVNPRSPGGMNNRQLIDRAKMVEIESRSAFDRPEGAAAKNKAQALEGGLERAWNNILATAREIQTLGPPPQQPPPFLEPKPGFDLNTSMLDAWLHRKADADYAMSAWQAEMADWSGRRAGLTNKILTGEGAALSDKLIDYVVGVAELAASVTKLQQAEIAHETAVAEQKTGGLHIDTFIAEQKLDEAKKQVEAASAKLSSGVSPLMLAAIGVPVIGVALYFFTKKKSPAVGGYRRRSRR